MSALWLALLLGGPALAAPAQAPAPAPVMPSQVPARVGLTVRVVQATKGEPGMDPRLESVASVLLRTGFSTFGLADQQAFKLADGASSRLLLPDGRTVSLTLTAHLPDVAHVTLRTERPGAEPVETSLSVKPERAFVYAVKTSRPDLVYLLLVDVRY